MAQHVTPSTPSYRAVDVILRGSSTDLLAFFGTYTHSALHFNRAPCLVLRGAQNPQRYLFRAASGQWAITAGHPSKSRAILRSVSASADFPVGLQWDVAVPATNSWVPSGLESAAASRRTREHEACLVSVSPGVSRDFYPAGFWYQGQITLNISQISSRASVTH